MRTRSEFFLFDKQGIDVERFEEVGVEEELEDEEEEEFKVFWWVVSWFKEEEEEDWRQEVNGIEFSEFLSLERLIKEVEEGG